MPPSVSRKRLRDDEEPSDHLPPPRKRTAASRTKPKSPTNRKARNTRSKPSVFETLDVLPKSGRSVEDNKAFLQAQAAEDSEAEGEDDDEEFEDVPGIAAVKSSGYRAKTNGADTKDNSSDEDEDEDEDEMEWEDAIPPLPQEVEQNEATEITDISVTLGDRGGAFSANNLTFDDARGVVGKKGPSKIERNIRLNTHFMHVEFLLYHNLVRNNWINDNELHKILLGQLSEGLRREIERWKIASGIVSDHFPRRGDSSSRATNKGKGKRKLQEPKQQAPRSRAREWGSDAERLEAGIPDTSHGDPTVRLLKYLAAYWHKRFRVTAPSLHKRGYLQPADLENEVKEWANSPKANNEARFGEYIKDEVAFRKIGKKCEGSRDVGAQLFTALLRAIGLDSRMVVSLQPVGFAFSKVEDGIASKSNMATSKIETDSLQKSGASDASPSSYKLKKQAKERNLMQSRKLSATPSRRDLQGRSGTEPISLDTSSSDELSDAPSSTSADSVATRNNDELALKKPTPFRTGSLCPTYWTEVISPINNTVIPVVALPTPIIANSAELLISFTPSGKAAEKAKQVLAYVVAYSDDRTAKDVTVRYLKKKLWPGKTRGFRVPKEKLPVYNKNGKVTRWIDSDWFSRAMIPYARDEQKRTEADQLEDTSDLTPVPVTKKDVESEGRDGKVGGKTESLQAYKSSAEYVLARHLRREEALLPGSKVVRHFTVGKGDNATDEPVYRRKDVVACKTIESWHKEGRRVKDGEESLKQVPVRAVTLIRKREAEEMQRETGEKPTQGLFAEHQTEWIAPDPLGPDRKIPKNVFGNIDVYVPSMVPEGAVHLPLKGSAKLCKRLAVDFAEACTGFEFGKQRAVPVLTGVVVAEENEGIVRDAWHEEQKRVKEKERAKRKAAALMIWKKFYAGLRITEKMKGEYGHGYGPADSSKTTNPFVNKNARGTNDELATDHETQHNQRRKNNPDYEHAVDHDLLDMDEDEHEGGFFREGLHVEEV